MQWAEAFLFAEVHLFFSLAAIFGSDFRTVAMCSHCSGLVIFSPTSLNVVSLLHVAAQSI